MSSASYLLTKKNLIINTPFVIQQFMVKNTTQFTIYIKTGGGNPTNTSYDFSIQPNSDFTSNLVSTNTLTIFSDASIFSNPANIIVYDSQVASPNNTPYVSNQSVSNVAGYPINVSLAPIINNYLYNAVLPAIKFDNFTPIYFLISGIGSYIIVNTADNQVIGACSAGFSNGIVYYAPTNLNTNITFSIYSNTSSPIKINAVYSHDILFKNQSKSIQTQLITLNVNDTTILNSCLEPPASYVDLILINSNRPNSISYNINVVIELTDINGVTLTLLSKNYTGAITTNTAYLEVPFLTVLPEYRLMRITVTNNLVVNPQFLTLYCGIFNY